MPAKYPNSSGSWSWSMRISSALTSGSVRRKVCLNCLARTWVDMQILSLNSCAVMCMIGRQCGRGQDLQACPCPSQGGGEGEQSGRRFKVRTRRLPPVRGEGDRGRVKYHGCRREVRGLGGEE